MEFSVSRALISRLNSAGGDVSPSGGSSGFPKIPAGCRGKYLILPGFADVHVHLREPGFSYKETVKSGTLAAARGGYTDVCAMPNLSSVPDSLPRLREELSVIERDAAIRVHAYASITVGERGEELSDIAELAPFVVGFSDDGKGVQSDELMRRAMLEVKKAGGIIAAHCEDEAAPCEEREQRMLERDLRLAAETGCRYHACHISRKESVELIREWKARGADISCETAPHYLMFRGEDAPREGRFKMNPPLGSEADREALREGLADGTIDMIATDHAPHTEAEKTGDYDACLSGIVGLETAFPALYTGLVRTGVISLDRLCEAMSVAPRERFGLPYSGDYSVWEVEEPYTVDPARFLSKGRSTPFDGETVYGKCLATICGGKTVWKENSTES